MKRNVFTLIIMLMMSAMVQAQSVYFECNVNTINKTLDQTGQPLLNEQGGYVYVPKGKTGSINGLLIYHCVYNDTYYAYDRVCNECLKKGRGKQAVIMRTDINCVCPNCESAFQNVSQGIPQQTNHSGIYDLKTYIVYDRGNGNLVITDKLIPAYLGI